MRHYSQKKTLVIFLILALVMLASPAWSAPVGRVTHAEGRVDVLKAGATMARPVSLGAAVDVGDIYRAKSGSKAEITFLNKNVLRIAAATRIEIKEYMTQGDRSSGVMRLERGRAQLISSQEFIKRVSSFAEGNKLEIHTPNAVAGIRGSNMIVFHERGMTGVFFVAGKGYTYNPQMPKVVIPITAGNISFILAPDKAPTPPRMATDKETITQIRAVEPTEKPKEEKKKTEEVKAPERPKEVAKAEDRPKSETPAAMTIAPSSVAAVSAPDTSTPTSSAPPPLSAPPPPPPPPPAADATAPVLTVTSAPASVITVSNASIATSTNEPAKISYRLDGGNWITIPASTVSLTGLAEGSHTFEIRATDAAGNVSPAQSFSWIVDTTDPVITLTSKPSSVVNSSTANFGLSANESVTYSYRLDGGSWITATASSFSLTGLSEGSHTIEIKAVDAAGIASSVTSYSWTTDYTNPPVSASGVPTGTTNQSSASITLGGMEAGATYQYSTDGGTTWTTTTGTISLAGLPEGSQSLKIKATDAAGNATTNNYSWTTDYTAPTISTAKTMTPTASATGDLSVSVTASETAAVSYKIDSGSYTTATAGSFTENITEGAHTLSIKATDAAGNESTPTTLNFTLNRYSLTGDAAGTGCALSGTATGKVAGILSQGWGGWTLSSSGSYSGSPSGTWHFQSGGQSKDSSGNVNGYWLDIASGTYSGSAMNGTSDDFSFITKKTLGTGSGTITGSHDATTYSLTNTGTALTETPLQFVSKFDSGTNTLYYANADGSRHTNGSLSGFMGGTSSPWTVGTAVDVKLMGVPDVTTHNKINTLWSHISSYNYNTGADTTYDGGAYEGYADAVVEEKVGGIKGRIVALYIDPAGKAGYLKGDYTGSLYSDLSMWAASGEISPYKKTDSIGILPTAMATSIASGSLDFNIAGFFGSGSGSVSVSSDDIYGCAKSLRNNTTHVAEPWGIFHYVFAGAYSNPSAATTWSAQAGGSATLGSYWNGTAWGSDSGYWVVGINNAGWATDGVSGSALPGTFLTPRKMGTITADLFGKYNANNTWVGYISGTWDGADLAFVNNFSTNLSYYHGSVLTTDGSLNPGYVGGTASLWSATPGSPASVTILGEYSPGTNPSHVWGSNMRSYNYANSTNTTYDGGAYWGYMKGIEINKNLEGRLAALYIDPSGNAGYLEGSLTSGTAYPGIGMFQMAGSVHPTQMASGTGISPADLASKIYEGSGTPYLSGAVGTGGSLNDNGSAGKSFKTHSIVNGTTSYPWGTYSLLTYGGYTSPSSGSALSGIVGGGNVAFGEYYSSTALQADKGVWMMSIDSGTWSGSTLTGLLTGTFLTGTKMGNISGDILGTYNGDGTWQAGSVGTWSGQSLSFHGGRFTEAGVWSSSFYDGWSSLNWTTGDGTWHTYTLGAAPSWDNGYIMGGTDSLLGASPAVVKVLGQFWPASLLQHQFMWEDHFAYSHNNITGERTTYDGHAYRGILTGITTPYNDQKDRMDGIFYALYIASPSTYKAGILRGTLTGWKYIDPGHAQDPYEMNGTIDHAEMNDNIGTTPANLYAAVQVALSSSIAASGSDGKFYNAGGDPVGNISLDNTTNLAYQSITRSYISGQDWGILSGIMGGTHVSSGTASDNWSITVDTSYNVGGDAYLHSMDITGTQWSDGKVAGTTKGYGVDLTQGKTWISVGDLLGTYDAGVSPKTWQAAYAGPFIETSKFLEMASSVAGRAALTTLNVPCVEIGRTDLKGSWSGGGNSIDMTGANGMNNVVFFAPTAGGQPQIWASGDVRGNYAGTPNGATVALSSAATGITANFNVQNWNTGANKFSAAVTNGSAPSGIGSYPSSFNFRGAAAGSITPGVAGAGTFSGTAAGITNR